MASCRGPTATSLRVMVVATLTLAAAIFMSTSEGCQPQSAQEVRSGRRFNWPEGREDGMYVETVEVDEQGVEQHEVKYLGKFEEDNTTLDGSWAKELELAMEQLEHHNYSRPGALRGGSGRKLLQDSGVRCTFGILDATETLDAILGLGRWFGAFGRSWGMYSRVNYVSGCTIAFGCNYASDQYYQFTVAGEIVSDNLSISRTCGSSAAGVYAHESEFTSFGRTFAGANFC